MLHRSVRSAAVAFVMLAWTMPALAQPLADRVPSDAILYVGWRGARDLGPDYANSRLKAVLDASEWPRLVNELLPRLLAKAGAGDPAAADAVRTARALATHLCTHPGALYFGGLDATNPDQPLPLLALLIDAGDQANAVLADVQALLRQAGGAPVAAEAVGNVVVISFARTPPRLKALLAPPAAAAAGQRDALADKPEFKAALAQARALKDPLFTLYADLEAQFKLLDALVNQRAGERERQEWAGIRDNLGLPSLKRFVWTCGFDGKDFAHRAFLAVPAPRAGLFAVLDGPGLSDDALRVVPRTAHWVYAGKLDLARLFSAIRDVAGKFDEGARRQLDQGLADAKQALGLDVETDLLAPLGDEWTMYLDPATTGTGMLGLVLVNRPKDAAKLERSLATLAARANDALKRQLAREGVQVSIRTTRASGATIHYLAIPFFAPSWAVRDGALFVALQPQGVASAIAAAEAARRPGGSIADSPAFQEARKRVLLAGAARPSSIAFVDLPATAPGSYPGFLAVGRLFLGLADMAGLEAPPMVMPPLHELLKHLAPAASATWVDDAGWHLASVAPFPGAEILATEANALVGSQAMAIGILLPAVNAARERANRVKCAVNLRQIGLGCMVYADARRGAFPPDLGTMVVEADVPWQVVTDCPTASSPRPAPPPDVQADKRKLADWVNANAAYVYLGAGLRNNAPADVIVAHDKPDNHERQGINVLFADGHVEWMTMPGFEQAKAQSAKALQDLKR